MEVLITKRPIVAEIGAGTSTLTTILARIATIRGRTADFGVSDDTTRAELIAGQSFEADFTADYYRDGFVEGGAPSVLPGWAFSRTGTGAEMIQNGTVSFVAADQPRITDKGLLVEGLRTNLLLHSRTFDAAAWSTVRASITPNVATAPDGTNTAVSLATDMTAADSHGVLQNLTGIAAGNHVHSQWVKAADRNQVALISTGSALSYQAFFQLTGDGSVLSQSAGSVASIVKGPDGWYRVSVLDAAAGGSGGVYIFPAISGDIVVDGNGATALLLWNGQLEAGDCPTSDIVTTTTAATRGQDVPTFTFQGTSDFSMIIEAELPAIQSNSYLITLMGASILDRLVVSRLEGNQINVLLATGGVDTEANLGSRSGKRTVRIAMSVLTAQTRVSLDGGAIQTIGGPRPPSLALASIGILGEAYSGLAAQGLIRSLVMIKRPLTDAELIAAAAS